MAPIVALRGVCVRVGNPILDILLGIVFVVSLFGLPTCRNLRLWEPFDLQDRLAIGTTHDPNRSDVIRVRQLDPQPASRTARRSGCWEGWEQARVVFEQRKRFARQPNCNHRRCD